MRAMELTGWTKNWRKKWDNPVLRGRPNHLLVWDWIIGHAVYEGQRQGNRVRFGGQVIELAPGQVTCGSRQIGADAGVKASTVRRVLSELTDEQLIEQRTDHQCSLITVKNWALYQSNEQGNDQRMDNDRATSDQRLSTKEEGKKVRREESTYACRPETESLFGFISELCVKYGIDNKVNKKALDVLVERYLSKVRLRVETQHCVSWLISKNLRGITDQRLGNWFKKAQEIGKREELRHLEWKQAQKDPHLAQRLKGQREPVFGEQQSIADFESSQSA